MTISSTVRVAGPFIGNGTASVFPFAFKVFAATDLDVIRLASSTGVETTLVLNSDYSVSLNGDQNSNPGGSVTLIAGALASGFTLVITSDIANLQPTDLTNQGGFYPEVITDALDRATIQIQQISDIGDRTLKIPITDGSLNMELPTSSARANAFLAFDANGLPTAVAAGSSGAPTTITRQVFNGTGSQTVFTLASDPGALGNSAQVFIGGVYQQRTTYTISGTTLTFSAAPVAGTGNIEFVNFLTSSIGATSADLVTYTPLGTGAVARSAASKFGDTVSVKDFGAVGDGVADDTAAIRSAIAYQQSTGIGNVTPAPAHYSKFWVHFPKGKYRITGDLSNGVQMNGLYLTGDHAVINVAPGVTAIGNINYMASINGLTFSEGATHIAIATTNPDTNMINVDECEFIEPTGPAITTASGSNSTQLSVTRCKFFVTNNANAQVCSIVTCDYARFEKCWVTADTAGTKAAFEVTDCNLTITELVGVDGPNLVYWIKVSGTGGGLYCENNRFGAEAGGPSGALIWWQAPALNPATGGLMLAMKNCMAYCTGPLVRFDAIPNIVDITGQYGLVLSPPAFVTSGITTTNIQRVLGDATNWFNIEVNGWNYNKLIAPDSTAAAIAVQGIPIAQEGVGVLAKPRASALILQIQGETGGYSPTVNISNVTASTGTNDFGLTFRQYASTANNAYFDLRYTTMLSGLSAGIYTAVVDLEVTTDTACEPRIKAGTHAWQAVLTKGKHTICVPFYYDTAGTVAGNVVSVDHYDMPNGCTIRIHRIRVFSGHVIVSTENCDMTGSAAPSGTIQAYVGDVVQNTAPVSAGYIGWVCTTAGTPGTWNTFGLIS